MPIRLGTIQFIRRSEKIHKNKYDYSKVEYIKAHEKVIIICKMHGEFLQKAYCHLNGYGCPKCGGTKKLTTKEFIQKAKLIHGDEYDYSKSKYIVNNIKVEIICKNHNSFWQKPNYHLLGQGCSKCYGNRKLTKENFIKKAKKIHNNKYDYSSVDYKNNRTKIDIICLDHGIFKQKPNTHLNGSGCPLCKHYISKPEKEFLDYLNISNRQIKILEFNLDGMDYENNTIYEFLGNYYHGNPEIYKPNEYNQKCKKTFGKLYQNTFKKFDKLKSFGYNIKYIWESDWKKFKDNIVPEPDIKTFLKL